MTKEEKDFWRSVYGGLEEISDTQLEITNMLYKRQRKYLSEVALEYRELWEKDCESHERKAMSPKNSPAKSFYVLIVLFLIACKLNIQFKLTYMFTSNIDKLCQIDSRMAAIERLMDRQRR